MFNVLASVMVLPTEFSSLHELIKVVPRRLFVPSPAFVSRNVEHTEQFTNALEVVIAYSYSINKLSFPFRVVSSTAFDELKPGISTCD